MGIDRSGRGESGDRQEWKGRESGDRQEGEGGRVGIDTVEWGGGCVDRHEWEGRRRAWTGWARVGIDRGSGVGGGESGDIQVEWGRRGSLYVCWLLNVPATCECISGTDLLRQF